MLDLRTRKEGIATAAKYHGKTSPLGKCFFSANLANSHFLVFYRMIRGEKSRPFSIIELIVIACFFASTYIFIFSLFIQWPRKLNGAARFPNMKILNRLSLNAGTRAHNVGDPRSFFFGSPRGNIHIWLPGYFFKNREVICEGARCRVVIDFHNLMHIRRLFLGALETRQCRGVTKYR